MSRDTMREAPGVIVNLPFFLMLKSHPLCHRFRLDWVYTYGSPQRWSKKRGFDVQLWFWHFRFFWRPFGGPSRPSADGNGR
jgi:hypothetical protein